jgi:L-lactate dehydrogenase complex protein LldG
MTTNSDNSTVDWKSRIDVAIRSYKRLDGMRKAFETNIDLQESNRSKIEGFEARRERAREVRRRALSDPSMLQKAIERLRSNGVRVHTPLSKQEALDTILKELCGEPLVVKSKSNVTKEIGLTHFLESKGVEVVETDVGDRIVQLAGEKTVHPTGPALHLTRYDIAKVLSKHFGREIAPDPDQLTEAIRTEVSDCINRASVGITGANFIAAEEGAFVIVHNEGNAAECARRPRKLIVVSGPEKLVPNLDESMNLAKLQTFYATGNIVSSFINVITAPSMTADIEKKTFYGMHGPREVVLVLVDNGRSSLQDKELMYCVNCGGCLLKCPVYDVFGSDFAGPAYLGGRGVCFTSKLEGPRSAIEGGISLCTTCGLCTEMCPVRIDVPRAVRETRLELVKKGFLPTPDQQVLIKSIRNYHNPWLQPRGQKAKWASSLSLPGRREVLYYSGCSPSLLLPELSTAAIQVLKKGGLEVAYLGRDEVCCGSPLLKLGEYDLFDRIARENSERILKTGAKKVITGCAGCFNMLRNYKEYVDDFDVEVQHVTEAISELVDRGRLNFSRADMNVTYHDPCDLGRHGKIFDEPRKILESMPGLELAEMKYSKGMSICCGSGGGVKTSYPRLAEFIGSRRIAQAVETGAQYLVTSCPWCEQNFLDSLRTYPQNIKVLDLIVLARDHLIL